jgi:hypothetical protein
MELTFLGFDIKPGFSEAFEDSSYVLLVLF